MMDASATGAARYAALFQSESREHLDELDVALLALERAPASPDVSAHVATLFRGMHTIKGMAAAMGYAVVERLAHALESRCEPLRSGAEPVSVDAMTLLFDGTSALRVSIDRAALGREDTGDEERVTALVAALRATSPDGLRASVSGAPAPVTAASVTATSATPSRGLTPSVAARVVEIRLSDDCPLKGVRAMIVAAKLGALGQVGQATPPQERWQDDAFDGVFSVLLTSDAGDDALVDAARSAGDVARVQVRAHVAEVASTAAPVRTVRLDARRLDTLLDLVGELVISRDRLLRAIEAMEQPDRQVIAAARDAARLVSVMQEEVLQTRLQPVSQVFDRFPRLVRDVAHELGKDVNFLMEGREIELDRALLDAIGDPILHLLRNALDHGVEDSETRRAAGKAPAGELILRAARDRGTIVIQVQDDGRGIDRLAVLRRAQHQGLVSMSETTLTDEALLPLVSRAGFSTAHAVTNLSGRGVGVDVVSTRVRALGGQVELETLEGEGTVFTLRLPATLAITRALLVEVQGETFAIPAVNVEEALAYHDALEVAPHALAAAGHRSAGARAITVRDEIVPLVALDEYFGLDQSSISRRGEDRERHVALVEAGGRRAALLVDALVAQQDIVVKPLDVVQGAAPWFSGATVLGDGTPALIVDVASIV
ncbi:MAG TPA: chemotaxis protein CheA [Gemmatimonas aurantiaca]|uniref:Chemotaxis protein CheA n=2 Tax=Gemmatimonas aurantiaca TaxID=173480 RepID=C1A888_GEMAT|nr:chemotaxis protein CheA [Gemmatimonas aurantiaca]BAH38448.1 chemotaxis protein CheA [Gemmatimonas aurantiaca T-27]HCT56224.1 chemotaxis protein CheA [Gemmatimonas aurantiaca]